MMKKLAKLLTRSATRRLIAFAITTLVTATLGFALDAELVATAIQALATVLLIAKGDDEQADELINDMDGKE